MAYFSTVASGLVFNRRQQAAPLRPWSLLPPTDLWSRGSRSSSRALQDRHLGLELTDAIVARGNVGLLFAVETRQLTDAAPFPSPPAVDGLVTDAQISSDLSDRTAGSYKIKQLAAELLRAMTGRGHGSFTGMS